MSNDYLDTALETERCLLCSAPIAQNRYMNGDQLFCCPGCQAVYQILEARQHLTDPRSHPLFQQALRSGLISNPALLDEIREQQIHLEEEEWQKLHLEILDMWCPSCAEVIRLTLAKEKGIKFCHVDYATDLATIEFAPRFLSENKIFRLIEKLGYQPMTLQDPRQQAVSRTLYLRFIVAVFFSLNVMMFAYPIYASYFNEDSLSYATLFAWLSLVGSIPVLTYSAWPIWRRFYTGLRVGVWGMETLVLIGVVAATALSIYELLQGGVYVYFDSMTVIIVFVLLGKIIESKAKFSAKDSLVQLTRAMPRRGRKQMGDGSFKFVSIKEIDRGDHIAVLAGEKIVLDGIISDGEGACDESLMTGESLPVSKKTGSTVLAGSILQQGHLLIKVTAKPEETALFRIIEMVEQDIGHKSRYVRAADRIVKWFVPGVLGVALATIFYCLWFAIADPGQTVLQTAIIRAISILLISCPCAIGIAAPLAEAYLLNALAKMGVIVRNRGCLAYLGKEDVFVFDKTGTITEGKFKVLTSLDNLSFEEKTCLKSLVIYSNHPIAVAINQHLLSPSNKGMKIKEMIGKGVEGEDGEDIYRLGSAIFLQQQGIITSDLSNHLNHEEIKTLVFFAKNKHCLTAIQLGDRVRSHVKEVLEALNDVECLLVSGDAENTVKKVAEECQFKRWIGECHPLQKRELIETFRQQGKIVAMFGDGINDAPALTASHVGIAVVSATDISIQVSDLLLTTDRLPVILSIRKLAQRGNEILKQNLFWAFFYNIIGIGLAMAGILSPLFAAFAMVTSSLIVLFNAQRVKCKKEAL